MFWQKHVPLFEQTLRKFETTLAQEGYIGHIDINSIVNSTGIYPLEFTCRFGHPQISIQRAGMVTPIGDFFWGLTQGKAAPLKVKKGFQVGVLIVVPPFPYKDRKTFSSFSEDAVVVFKKTMSEGIHPQDLRCYKNEWLVTGSAGIALLVTGCGTTMKEAKKHAYNRVQNITLPNMYYRNDISDRWDEDGDKLRSWGYI
jgi:phosphoribosylamine--glycine ligase